MPGFKRIKTRGAALACALMALSVPCWSADAEAAPIAGLAPYERPMGAPVIASVARTPEQAARLTYGVDQPLPAGLDFLKNQGHWYTPFSRSGMTSVYDLRGWHKSSPDRRADNAGKHDKAAYSPLHFRPAIETAKDEDCLACHKEVLTDKPRAASPAGLKAATARAWYQQASTYTGEQDSFHRRHLVTEFSRQVMNLSCNTCHLGHDPREEVQGGSATSPQTGDTGFVMRKQVNPETTCLKCHGQFPYQNMGLPMPWSQARDMFQNNCLICHAAIRTNRHNVSYLNAERIEELGKASSDSCYGCHGGRAWYRISYPYARNAWDGMTPEVPDWAKARPTQSEARFRISKPAK
jgi:nitrate/TMAO reductase-like tetraheme cytochrome c subunit